MVKIAGATSAYIAKLIFEGPQGKTHPGQRKCIRVIQ